MKRKLKLIWSVCGDFVLECLAVAAISAVVGLGFWLVVLRVLFSFCLQ